MKHAIPFSLAVVVVSGLFSRWSVASRRHRRRMSNLTHRVHVNGIRGKSTVTRLIAGVLREAGLVTLAKTTGTAAAIIDPDGKDQAVHRYGPPTILEQLEIVRRVVAPQTEALVIECMAINPAYQRASERLIVHSTIGVLTNVREDHQDLMGESLTKIARSLLSTCPTNGVLITAERNPALLPIIRQTAERNGTRLVMADPESVTDAEIAAFSYVSFKDNVAIGLAVAAELGIARDVAIRGMLAAAPDPGVLRIEHFVIADMQVTWANLFAVNDRESMMIAMEQLEKYRSVETTFVGILNNRSDRERRALQFADVAVNDLRFDRLVTFGAFETPVTKRLVSLGYPREHIINLGKNRSPTIDEMIDKMIRACPTPHVVLVGFVNIHTDQADRLLEFFGEQQIDHAAVAQFETVSTIEPRTAASAAGLGLLVRST
ncbi:MAG: poly-gamma-glutamate synthase PgsB [Acidimicrobiia bacterium]|nr:poly-gamma-glutamate synthase PgsB [Acidimicrobiia bacterium]